MLTLRSRRRAGRFARSRFWLVAAGVLIPSAAQATIVDFEGLTSFLSPGSSIPGITVSPAGGIVDEASVSLVTGLSFPAGTVATSGSNVLGNLFGPTLTITFDRPATAVTVETVGSLAGGVFGTITVEAFAGSVSLGSQASDRLAIGDSGAPETLLSLGTLSGITSLMFSSDVGGASSFLIDDLTFTSVPEPSTALLLLAGLAAVGRRSVAR